MFECYWKRTLRKEIGQKAKYPLFLNSLIKSQTNTTQEAEAQQQYSSDDEISIPDEDDTILQFGPYIGSTYTEVWNKDPDYCRRCSEALMSRGRQQAFYDFGLWCGQIIEEEM